MSEQIRAKGFTLIELIMVLVLIGVLSTIAMDIIIMPVRSYIDLSRRATLVDSAELTLRRMQRDIRRALPNSIRITGGGTVLEILHTVDGGRYRAAGTGDTLDFYSAGDTSFDVIGTLQNFTEIDVTKDQLVIYNLGTGNSQSDAYQSSNNNRATLTSASATSITFTSKKFPFQSPQQRFFIVDTPITYQCDIRHNQLLRYDNYTIAATQPNPPAVTGQLQAKQVANCSFSYSAGTGSRSGLVNLEITLTDEAGESARLINQVHVDNIS